MTKNNNAEITPEKVPAGMLEILRIDQRKHKNWRKNFGGVKEKINILVGWKIVEIAEQLEEFLPLSLKRKEEKNCSMNHCNSTL